MVHKIHEESSLSEASVTLAFSIKSIRKDIDGCLTKNALLRQRMCKFFGTGAYTYVKSLLQSNMPKATT